MDDETPNIFCRRAPRKDIRPPPAPLAFLHRIVAEHGVRMGGSPVMDSAVAGPSSWPSSWGASMERSSSTSSMALDPDGSREGESSWSQRTSASDVSANSGRGDAGSGSTASNGTAADHDAPTAQAAQVKDDELEAPWFSQLASLPQLRSAGIPLIPPNKNVRTNSTMASDADARSKARSGALYTPSRLARSAQNGSTSASRDNASSSTSSSAVYTASPPSRTDTSSWNPSASLASIMSSNSSIPTPVSAQYPTGSALQIAALGLDPETNLDEDLIPPDNFAMVNTYVYRSSFPKKKHFPFLRTLGLRSVLTLILEEYPDQNTKFLDEQGITFFQFGIPGNKEPFVHIPSDKITAALVTILDRRNHPMLIHCNKGKHRTGCLIGCLRKLQHWSLTTIFDEYRRFSFPKSRSMDQEFVELYDQRMVWNDVDRRWLPRWSVLPKGIMPSEEDLEEVSDRGQRGM